MRRLQLHLTDDQDRRLRATAKRLGVSRAALIRRGVERVLAEADGGPAWLDLIGQAGPAGRPDVSDRHDQILVGDKLRRR